jgi:hypothetical protein
MTCHLNVISHTIGLLLLLLLLQIPLVMFLMTHAYFLFYHAAANMVLRRVSGTASHGSSCLLSSSQLQLPDNQPCALPADCIQYLTMRPLLQFAAFITNYCDVRCLLCPCVHASRLKATCLMRR